MRWFAVLVCASVGSVVIFGALVHAHQTGASATLPPPPDLHGSADCDGDVDAVDALAMLRYVARLPVRQHEPCVPVGDAMADGIWIRHIGDVDCDNDVEGSDAHRLLQYVAGLLEPPRTSAAGVKPSPSPVVFPAWSCPPIGWDFGTE